MGRPCACCTSPRRSEIDTAITAGATAKAIAATVGLNATQVSRHRRICLQAPVLTTEEQAKLWLSRAEELWVLAGANGDLRALATALQQGLRSLEFSIKRAAEEAQAQTARDLPLDVSLWTGAEASKFRTYVDHVLQTTQLPSVEEYATCFGTRFLGEKKHEHPILPLRLT